MKKEITTEQQTKQLHEILNSFQHMEQIYKNKTRDVTEQEKNNIFTNLYWFLKTGNIKKGNEDNVLIIDDNTKLKNYDIYGIKYYKEDKEISINYFYYGKYELLIFENISDNLQAYLIDAFKRLQ